MRMIESACDLGTAVPIPMPWGAHRVMSKLRNEGCTGIGDPAECRPGDAAAPSRHAGAGFNFRRCLHPPHRPVGRVAWNQDRLGILTHARTGMHLLHLRRGGRRLDDLNPGVDRKTTARLPMPWAKHRIERLQKIRSTKGLDDQPECRAAALRAPSPEADASFRFRRNLRQCRSSDVSFFDKKRNRNTLSV